MSDEPQSPTGVAPARDESGRLVTGGGSLNPGGKTKLVGAAIKALKRGSLPAAEYLNKVVAGTETTTVLTKDGPLDVPVPARERIAAALGILKIVLPRKIDIDPGPSRAGMSDVQRAVLAKLSGLDS